MKTDVRNFFFNFILYSYVFATIEDEIKKEVFDKPEHSEMKRRYMCITCVKIFIKNVILHLQMYNL